MLQGLPPRERLSLKAQVSRLRTQTFSFSFSFPKDLRTNSAFLVRFLNLNTELRAEKNDDQADEMADEMAEIEGYAGLTRGRAGRRDVEY